MTALVRPPFAYYGGKQRLAGAIVSMLPPHTHYVEPFAGGLSVLLAKTPARLETVNDVDGDLMHFWRILRDRPAELTRACALTPHSRMERNLALDRPADLDDIERARRIWVCLAEGRTGTLRRTGWRFDAADFAHASMPSRLDGYVRRMEAVAHRLRGVSLESRHALDVIDAYGKGRRTLLYVDPPYLGEVRNRNYRNEMTSPNEHRDIAEALRRCAATVVVSGYPSHLYDTDLYPDWYRITLTTSTSQGGTWKTKTEVLWSNRPLRRVAPAETELDLDGCNGTASIHRACNETRCRACNTTMQQPTTGRRRQYCSPACRVRAHRQRSGAPQDHCPD